MTMSNSLVRRWCTNTMDKPAPFWMSLGFSQQKARTLEALQRGLDGGDNVWVHHTGDISIRIAGCVHHDLLLPHWREYMRKHISHRNVNAIYIEGGQLHKSVLEVILPPLQSMTLEHLVIRNNRVDREGLLLISKFVSQNTTIKRIQMIDCRVDDHDVAQSLSMAISTHPKLEDICITECGLENIMGIVLQGCTRLKKLSIGEYESPSDISCISSFLSENNHLEEIHVYGDGAISDADALHIASALKRNATLKKLDLGNNKLSKAGAKVIRTVMLDSTSLNSIADSNHTCRLISSHPHGASCQINDKGVHWFNPDWTKGDIIRFKILYTLYMTKGEKSAAQYFEDVPLEFIPFGLGLIQKDACNVWNRWNNRFDYYEENEPRKKLNRMYCFLRGWNMPSLFERRDWVHSPPKRKKRKTLHDYWQIEA